MAPSSFNAFAKPIDGITNKSSVGGAITLLASSAAAILFLSQLILYFQVDVQHSLDLAPSTPLNIVIPSSGIGSISQKLMSGKSHPHRKKKTNAAYMSDMISSLQTFQANRIEIFVHVTFPHFNCQVVDYSHNNAKQSTGEFARENGHSKFVKRRPTEYDYAIATGQSTVIRGKELSRKKTSTDPESENSCTIRGTIIVPRIGGDLSFFMSEQTFSNTAQLVQMGLSLQEVDAQTGGHDSSHYIHEISFGAHFPLAIHPLKDKMVTVEDPSGISLNQIAVKLIPTKYKRFARRKEDMYQISMSNYIVAPSVLFSSYPMKMPGLTIHYDFDPMAVHHVESRENFFVFLSSLIGIVGGVFVTVRLVSSMLVNTTAAVMKKMD